MSERIIDSVKRCAKRAIEIQGLSFTELQTKMLERSVKPESFVQFLSKMLDRFWNSCKRNIAKG